MKPKIQISPKGGSELEPYVDVAFSLQSEIEAAGIEFEEFRTRFLDPTISTLVVSITGSVASHFIITLIDSLLAKKKEKNDKKVNIVVVYSNSRYSLPEKRSALLRDINKKVS